MRKLYPKCLDKKELSLCYTGHILPCCWINDQMNNPEWRSFFSEELHIDNFETIDEIFETTTWQEFIDMLKNNPENAPRRCKQMCRVPLHRDIEGKAHKVDFKK